MKKRKNYLEKMKKLWIISFLLLIYSCQEDNFKLIEKPKQKEVKTDLSISSFNITQLNEKDLNKNKKLNKIFQKSYQNNKTKIAARKAVEKQKASLINTKNFKFLESKDKKYHSYTFEILDQEQQNIKNLLISLNQKNEYETYLVTYHISKKDVKKLSFEQFLNKKVTFQNIKIDSKKILDKIAKREAPILMCVAIEKEQLKKIPDFLGDNVGASNMGDSTGYHYVSEWITVSQSCEWVQESGNSKNNYHPISDENKGSGNGGGGLSYEKPFNATVFINTKQHTKKLKNFISGTIKDDKVRTYYSGNKIIKNFIDTKLINSEFSGFVKLDMLEYLTYGSELNLDENEFIWYCNNSYSEVVSDIEEFSIEHRKHPQINKWIKGQIELHALAQDERKWKESRGYIGNLKYTHSDTRSGKISYFKMVDGSIIATAAFEQTLSKTNDLIDKYRFSTEINPNERYYYIKLPNSNTWSEYLLKPSYSTKDELETLFALGAKEGGQILGTYVLPIEDIKILIDGKDFNGKQVAKWQAAGGILLTVVPGAKISKVFKPVAKIASNIKVWKIVVSSGGKTYTRVVKEVSETTLKHFDNYAPNTSKLIDDALRSGKYTDAVINEVAEVIADVSNKKGRKLTWAEVNALLKDSKKLADGASDWVKFLDDPVKANKFSDEIIEINKLTEGGGNLLSGTPASAINTAGYYNTVAEQGASIFKTIIKNHMFIDGNKRTAVEMFKSFCSKSNIRLTLNDSQLMDVATKVATGKIDDVLEISKNLVK